MRDQLSSLADFTGFDVSRKRPMMKFCLTVARFSVSAWVGAAVLFVVNTVISAQSTDFDSVAKANLASLRFPPYYYFGFVLVGVTLVLTSLVTNHWTGARWRIRSALFLLALALLAMIVDYVWVLQPMLDAVRNTDAARPANFQTYHYASMYMNTGHVSACFVAALLLCWPHPQTLEVEDEEE